MFISKFRINKTRFLKRLSLLIVVIMLIYWREYLISAIMIIGDRDEIITILGNYGVLGPAVLSMILGLQVFLAVIPGHAFIVAGGYVYGFILGVLITQVSTVAASQIAFLLTRRYGRPLVDRLAPAEIIDHWKMLAEKQNGLFFFFSFILPVFPNDLMCFVAGLSAISSKKFFRANFFWSFDRCGFVYLDWVSWI